MPILLAAAAALALQGAPAESFDQQYARARDFANGGQPEQAITLYTKLLADAPKNPDVLLGRGIVYSRQDRWAEAQRDLDAAAAAAPDYADVWQALGNMYRWSGRPAQAAQAFERLVTLRPQDADARIARGLAYRDQGMAAAARIDFEQAGVLGADKAKVADYLASLAPRAANPDAAAPVGYRWAASISGTSTDVQPRDQHWSDSTVSVRRYFDSGSLGAEVLRAKRFGLSDTAYALDGYVGLWQGAYANLRYQQAPDATLFPAKSWRGEVFQSFGGGWELSLGDDVLGFDGNRVDILGLGLGRYVGNFYIRLRHTKIESSGSSSTGDRLLVRWYYAGDGDNYLELAASRGRSADPLDLIGGQLRSGATSLNAVRYFTPEWGVKFGASYSSDTGGASERALSLSLSRRW